ncbi:MAG: GNAT family N-acetyltransferase [Oscillospiraceae bacterium]|nr:GNAT family N-acetyltransferase [Oscillospiraceae bacterium]
MNTNLIELSDKQATAARLAEYELICFPANPWSADMVLGTLMTGFAYLVETEYGYALGRVSYEIAELLILGIFPEHRGKGMGKALLAEFIAETKRKHYTVPLEKIFLEAMADNTAALRLYTSAGFTEIYRRKDYYAVGSDGVIMELGL